ncbi:MAG TPA: alanine--tRNA ligase [Acidimicrobiales bacterium]|nr:alanine--tRNA ligase [Acidimicrobiales bacterium]
MHSAELRRAFTEFFVARGHTAMPSVGLIPLHPAAPMFTNAGMVQFLPYILGEEPPAFPRATSIQKCVRISGKDDDIENIGYSPHHGTFFEMLGNFSFGDYFKEQAIPIAWDLVTNVFGFDPERLWVTVHHDDTEAPQIWRDVVGVPADRIQALGKDNFWEMAETGPCGPCSEIFFDKGPEFGEGGGPAHGADARYPEFWNLVFMQYQRHADGTLTDLPLKVIDTGAGFERVLSIINGNESIFDLDVIRPIIGVAEGITGTRYGADDKSDVVLRILADHARSVTFLVNDGVFPSNEDRGYVLRRILRRAVRHAFSAGVERLVFPELVQAVVGVMGEAYPELGRNQDFITGVVSREEERFRQTLKAGMGMLEAELDAAEGRPLAGDVVFKLHDTFGFPKDLTRELAGERGIEVDMAGFDAAMAAQQQRGREGRKGATATSGAEQHAALAAAHGPTEFTGYTEYESKATILAVLPAEDGTFEVFVDRTPFYAEGGGQVGDTGTITTDTGRATVLDTVKAPGGLHRHIARVDGEITEGQEAVATIDGDRRDAIRRNHTGTHMLHWALREVLGPHVRQHGSLVAPEHMRFDFSHYGPLTPEEIDLVESLANGRILDNEPVRAYETTKEHAEQIGAIAFFDEKYGDVVRVIEAGHRSMELCGGTHVSALGMIGPVEIVSEASIGANLRRIFAVTGTASLERKKEAERRVGRIAELLRATPDEATDAVEKLVLRQKALEDELKTLRRGALRDEAASLAAGAVDGVVVARRDDLAPDQLKELAVATRERGASRAVVLGGSPDGVRVALVAAVGPGGTPASEILAEAARIVGGGGSKHPELAVAGGKDPSRIDEALDRVRAQLGV